MLHRYSWGAMLGGAFGAGAHYLFPHHTADPGAYAIVGMGALVAGTTQAPIQSFLMLFELTQNYKIIAPIMICCVISTFVARSLKKESIYTMKLVRRGVDIRAGRDVNVLKSIRVNDFMTEGPEIIREDTRLRELINVLQKSKHSTFPVVDDEDELVGMLSLKDFREVVFEDSIFDIVIAKDIATIPAMFITPGDNLATALHLIDQHGVGHLPVIRETNGNRKVVGILSQSDIMSAYNHALEERGLMAKLRPSKT